MARQISPAQQPAVLSEALADARARVAGNEWPLKIQVVTPIFGGGVATGEIDDAAPISAKGIRGQLRFWWRIMTGFPCAIQQAGQPDQMAAMALREAALFGSADTPSSFDLVVRDIAWGQPKYRKPEDDEWFGFPKFGAEAYALFPARERQLFLLREGLQFGLVVRWPEQERFKDRRRVENERRVERGLRPLESTLATLQAELKSSLWAWINFGGIGSRTRRGLGTIHCGDPGTLNQYSLDEDGSRLRFPISVEVYLGTAGGVGGPLSAWRAVLEKYRSFRQKQRNLKLVRRGGREQTLPEGRSHWPEPDAIRRITSCNTPTHQPVDRDPPMAFPRALLGLPITFAFDRLNGPGRDRQGRPNPPIRGKDPAESTLRPLVWKKNGDRSRGERLASPVITRPVFLQGAWRAAVIVLRAPALNALDDLEAHLDAKGFVDGAGPTATSHDVPHSEIVGPAVVPADLRNGQANAIDAFIKWSDYETLQDVLDRRRAR